MKTFGQILLFFAWLIGITIFTGVFGAGGFFFFLFGTLVPVGIWLANRK
jgi:hypothetical protein